jgi:nitrogen regulatory protein P-II 1
MPTAITRRSSFQTYETFVKQITAILKPFKLEECAKPLQGGVTGLTVTEIRSFRRQATDLYRGAGMSSISCQGQSRGRQDRDVDRCVEAIVRAARTAKIGDGRFFVTERRACVCASVRRRRNSDSSRSGLVQLRTAGRPVSSRLHRIRPAIQLICIAAGAESIPSATHSAVDDR